MFNSYFLKFHQYQKNFLVSQYWNIKKLINSIPLCNITLSLILLNNNHIKSLNIAKKATHFKFIQFCYINEDYDYVKVCLEFSSTYLKSSNKSLTPVIT